MSSPFLPKSSNQVRALAVALVAASPSETSEVAAHVANLDRVASAQNSWTHHDQGIETVVSKIDNSISVVTLNLLNSILSLPVYQV